MNPIAQPLLWCCLQVTVLALAALVIGTVFGRRRPAAGAVVAATSLIAVVGLSAMALSPWPRWHWSWDRVFGRSESTPGSVVAQAPTSISVLKMAAAQTNVDGPVEDSVDSEPSGTAPASESVVERPLDRVAGNRLMILGALYLVGFGAMAVRFGWGLATVRRYRRESLPLADRRLLEFVDVVRAQLGCQQAIEVRESARSSTPATIGWRRPVLLLPKDWSTWTDEECLAVLAHEIEHVRRGDFAAWVAAQFGVALHFYHPLVHGLAGCLRLQQELAADAAAARVLGGQRKYVTTLAAMALRQSDAAVAWPARAFLPTSKTFLRRIEMLHRSKSLRGDISRPVSYLSIAVVAAIALCAAGLRGSAAGDDPQVDPAPLVVPSNAAAQPGDGSAYAERASTNNLKQLALAMHNYHDVNGHFPPAVVMGPDGKTPHSWRVELLPFLQGTHLYHQYRMGEPWNSPANTKILEQMPDVFRSPFDDPKTTKSGYYVFAGPGTVFDGDKGIRISDIMDGLSNTLLVVEAKQGVPWTKPEDIAFDPTQPPSTVRGFVGGRFLAALADGSVRPFTAIAVKDQLTWLILRHDGRPIDWDKLGAGQTPKAVGSPAVGGQALRDKNNLKQLALAMHNYHDVHGHFPPAVVMGPDGKTPHSWRVELLPFLDNTHLYHQYRMGEPWDSPANTKILEQMPAVFRSPFDDPTSTKSGYYVFAGPGTVFDGDKGIRISDIMDGTSNTLLIVEAKQDIPWTKPADIPFDPTRPPSNVREFVRGRFFAALADGSVRPFGESAVKDQLVWLILRHDGRPIDWETLRDDPSGQGGRATGPAENFVVPAGADGGRNRGVRDMNNLRNLALAAFSYHDVFKHFPPAVVIDPVSKTPRSWRVELLPYVSGGARLYGQYRRDEPWDSPANKKVLEQMPGVFRSPYDDPKSFNSGYYALTGPDTAAGATIREITDGTSNTLLYVSAKRNIPWTKPEDIPFKAGQPLPTLGGFVPGEFTAAVCDSSARRYQIDQVKGQLEWMIRRNDGHPIDWERIAPQALNRQGADGRRAERFAVPVEMAVRGSPPVHGEDLFRDKNNLKMLGLAMHNYHDVNRHFPEAVVIGPDGKTPHSWRVELLPFMNSTALYQQYRLNEPWDSPANKQVLAQMPNAFHNPYDDPKSLNSGYYFLAGPDTAAGARIRDITDGTTNTILLVEAKRNIPWTKPEDIPFDRDKPLPTLGGFIPGQFGAVMCDGSFRRYKPDQVKDHLKWLIIRNDGNYIPAEIVQGVND